MTRHFFFAATHIGTLLRLVALSVIVTTRSQAGATWNCFESAHFTVWSDASKSDTTALLVDLEVFRSEVLAFTALKPDVAQRVSVVCFRSDQEFTPYKPRFEGRSVATAAGVFNGSAIQPQIALTPSNSRRVIYHEYVHSLYRELKWDTPLWFNEGSAELFSTFRTRRNVAYFGEQIPEHVALLRRTKLMPLAHLFSVTTTSEDYNRGIAQGTFYAEAWAFVHSLACSRDPAWRAKLNAFLALLNSGHPPDDATFERAFGVGMAEMQARLESYIYGGSYAVQKQTCDRKRIEHDIRVRSATADEIALEQTILDLTIHHAAVAKLNLLDIPLDDPRAARAQEALAIAALQDDDELTARECLARAVSLNTPNTQTYWVLAQALTRDWLTRDIDPTKRIGVEIAEQLRALLHRVLKENPEAVEAWDELARVEAFCPHPDRHAIATIEAAVRRWPDDPQVPQIRVLIAFAHHRCGKDDIARAMTADVLGSSRTAPSTRGLATNLLRDLLPAAGTR